ncbi:ATP-binding protein [Clostridium sporogenes]|uniref:ATP-binding protein n=1 Tax=Clostridium sporogenes TaxID=1509 RepID=UPI0005EE30FF|nr:ATP-binding protein [Clostridium sporogenes]MBW5457619.1 ATP-binding protein [Clostridium sporogenes]NFQ04050.1 ATP-binding protein [Clostridium sporogenes]NFQ43440.1 ATP-binding protein [Clostridium sporogenes]NFT01815.1 ATP-binding protein [Clostridium sporogenes]NFT31055.1 ATP-binding protein [Clostridium sporogenes]
MKVKSNLNQLIFIGFLVMFSSQIYIKLFVNHFNISFGIIVLIILLYMIEMDDKIMVAITSSFLVYIIRIFVYFLENSEINSALKLGISNHFPEFIFYLVYITIYFIITIKNKNLNTLLFKLIICDFFANFTEMSIRHTIYLENFSLNIIIGLIFVAFLRSTLIWVMINLMIRYNTTLLKKEHTERYIKLLASNSTLKSEVYLMEKSMDNIEKVMGKSYKLYMDVSQKDLDEALKTEIMEITKDIHEIKKEFNLIVRGVNSLTNTKELKDSMNYYEILDILRHMVNIQIKNTKINFKIGKGENFNTIYHYYLISIFRNIIMNSIDALKDKDNGLIYLNHNSINIDNINGHCFEIIDNGQGIDKEDKKYVFNPGFSTKIDFNTGDVNRGLGLSIVKDIVETKLNGFVTLTSTKGKGTKFMIFIPKDILEGARI